MAMTMDEAVMEVLGLLTGMDMGHDPELDRYRTVVRALNRALRANALEAEWSCYAETTHMGSGFCRCGDVALILPARLRPRINGDDAVRLVDEHGSVLRWAYFLPRDALHKYRDVEDGLWVSATGSTIHFSRPLTELEAGLDIVVPTMRDPIMLVLPDIGEDVPDHLLHQRVDFLHPDLVVARAAYLYAQSDPVTQPRVPTLEQDYKNLMYQLIERDSNHTDTPYMNEFDLGLESGLVTVKPRPDHPTSNFFR